MAKFDNLAASVVELVGGAGNVEMVTHCITRLRFNVKDKAAVKTDEIKKCNGVINTNWSGNQIQIIIGQDVGEAYELVMKQNPALRALETEAVNENLDAPKKQESILDRLIGVMSGCFTPLIPLLMGSGLIKVILMVCTMTGILTTEMSTYQIFNFAADAGFYFLPIFVAGTAAKYFNTSVGLAYVLGAMLIHPTYIANYSNGVEMTLFGIKVFAANYTSAVFPSLICVFVMSYVQKFFAKHSPKQFRALIEPLATLLVMIPLTLLLLAPLGSMAGTLVSSVVVGLYGKIGFLGVGVMCALYPILVLTGMHRMFMPYHVNSFATLGYEPFYILSAFISNFNQGIACLVVAIKSKNHQIKELGSSSAFTAVFAGITEPAMYAITTRFKKAFICAMIGNAVGGLTAGIFGVVSYAYPGSAGIFGLPCFLGERGISNMIFMVVACIVGMVTTFVTGMIAIKPEELQ